MENNEIMDNSEEVIETAAEEIGKTGSRGCLKTVSTIGIAMIGGALAYKFIVVPAVDKFRTWNESRKMKAQERVTVMTHISMVTIALMRLCRIIEKHGCYIFTEIRTIGSIGF